MAGHGRSRLRAPRTPARSDSASPLGWTPRPPRGDFGAPGRALRSPRDGRPRAPQPQRRSCSTPRSPSACFAASLGLLAVGEATREGGELGARGRAVRRARLAAARRRAGGRRSPCSSSRRSRASALRWSRSRTARRSAPTLALYWVAARRRRRRASARALTLATWCSRSFAGAPWSRAASFLDAGDRCSASCLGAAPGWPATGPGCAASGWRSSRSARCAPSARPSASAAWRRPRSAGASPATCTTRPATRST